MLSLSNPPTTTLSLLFSSAEAEASFDALDALLRDCDRPPHAAAPRSAAKTALVQADCCLADAETLHAAYRRLCWALVSEATALCAGMAELCGRFDNGACVRDGVAWHRRTLEVATLLAAEGTGSLGDGAVFSCGRIFSLLTRAQLGGVLALAGRSVEALVGAGEMKVV